MAVRIFHREALESLDLEGWLEEYVTLRDGGGAERRIEVCPECGDDRYKLYVNVEKKQWICYMCDWGRGKKDVVELMASLAGRSETEIRIELATMVVPAPAGDLATQLMEKFSQSNVVAEVQPAPAVPVPGTAGFTGLSSQPVLQYALSRGLTQAQVTSLGVQPAIKVPAKRMGADGRVSEVFGPWLVFPVRLAGKAVAWQGRRVWFDGDLKYLSSQGIHDWLWPLDDHFFRVYQPGKPVFIVEGVFDAMGLLHYGIPALCSFGKSINDKQVAILSELVPAELVIMWDADAWKEITRAADRLMSRFTKVSVVDTSNTGKKIDAGDALKDKGVVPWLAERIKTRMDVRSPEFLQKRLDRLTA